MLVLVLVLWVLRMFRVLWVLLVGWTVELWGDDVCGVGSMRYLALTGSLAMAGIWTGASGRLVDIVVIVVVRWRWVCRLTLGVMIWVLWVLLLVIIVVLLVVIMLIRLVLLRERTSLYHGSLLLVVGIVVVTLLRILWIVLILVLIVVRLLELIIVLFLGMGVVFARLVLSRTLSVCGVTSMSSIRPVILLLEIVRSPFMV